MKVERYKSKGYKSFIILYFFLLFTGLFILLFIQEKCMVLNIKDISKTEVEFIRKLEIKKGDILVFKAKSLEYNYLLDAFTEKVQEITGLTSSDFLLIVIQEENDLYKIDKEKLVEILDGLK